MTGTRPPMASVKMPCRCSSVGTVEITVPADRLPLPLIVDEEERAVLANRPARNAAELVAAELGLAGRWSRKKLRAFSASLRRNSNAVP